uniref:Uncharacterized protein n=1 Tax=Romanomermis culicivorax TaxID=13658 RepID=A0A915KMY5_ROMCU
MLNQYDLYHQLEPTVTKSLQRIINPLADQLQQLTNGITQETNKKPTMIIINPPFSTILSHIMGQKYLAQIKRPSVEFLIYGVPHMIIKDPILLAPEEIKSFI